MTSGPYAWLRHPSYFGWFLWAIGTQAILSNFICFWLWFAAAITFFRDRLDVEEYYLMDFFGKKYIKYASKTPIGIPLVYGNDILIMEIEHLKAKTKKKTK